MPRSQVQSDRGHGFGCDMAQVQTRAGAWNAALDCKSFCSQLSHTTHLNTINLNQGDTEEPNLSTGRQTVLKAWLQKEQDRKEK